MNWVFLIQREGERTWQPIQTPILEVEECRYRLIGQTNISHLCAEVRVIGTPPCKGGACDDRPAAVNVEPFEALSVSKYRQTYFRRTNSEGLIIILPFTYFFAGLWELSCCCDAMSELMGENWRVSQQIFSIPKAGYLELPTKFNLPEPVSSSTTKVLPPKLNLTFGKVMRKSPQLPKLPS